MGVTKRVEYHWIDGRVVPCLSSRPRGVGRWPKLRERRATLVVAIEEGDLLPKEASVGEAYTLARATESIAMHLGIASNEAGNDVGRRVPRGVLDKLRQTTKLAESSVTRQFNQLADENRTTGALFTRLEEQQIEAEGWRISIVPQVFSQQAKEPGTGADGGIVVTIVDQMGNRVSKACWFQAKRSRYLPHDPLDLPGLRQQLAEMKAHTSQAFGLVFTSNGIRVVGEDKETEFSELLASIVSCQHGDRNAAVIINTRDHKFVLRIFAVEAARYRSE